MQQKSQAGRWNFLSGTLCPFSDSSVCGSRCGPNHRPTTLYVTSHVWETRRFCVILSDGTKLPVPEKKYTQIKRLLLRENNETAALLI